MEISRFPFNGRQLHDDNLPVKPKAAEMRILFLVSPLSLLQKLLNEGSSILGMSNTEAGVVVGEITSGSDLGVHVLSG